MDVVVVRPGRPEDAEEGGRICFEAFRSIAEAHGFPPDFPSVEDGVARTATALSRPGTRSFVACRRDGGAVLGSVFVHDRWPVAAIGPITVDPEAQNRGVGRRLMEEAMAWTSERGFPSVRLIQAAYHNRSLSLYASLGFDVREPLSVIQGPPVGAGVPGRTVRPAREADMDACNRLCEEVHGFARAFETERAIGGGYATVVERDGAISGYATRIGFRHHAVAASNEDLEALIDAATEFSGPGFLLPTRNGDVLRWCLERGLRIVMPMTLMTTGWYQEPVGPYLASSGF
jgi:GNAT superfamily N-acetyltransferase